MGLALQATGPQENLRSAPVQTPAAAPAVAAALHLPAQHPIGLRDAPVVAVPHQGPRQSRRPPDPDCCRRRRLEGGTRTDACGPTSAQHPGNLLLELLFIARPSCRHFPHAGAWVPAAEEHLSHCFRASKPAVTRRNPTATMASGSFSFSFCSAASSVS